MTVPGEFELKLEAERALSKHRYCRGRKNKKKKWSEGFSFSPTAQTAKATPDLASIFGTDTRALGAKEHLRLEKIAEYYEKNKMRQIYNPFSKCLNFNSRRATDYRLNKSVKLPDPLGGDAEFECETRRRGFLKTFHEYIRTATTPSKKIDKKKKETSKKVTERKRKKKRKFGGMNIINLPEGEILAIESLKKRVKSGEIVISQTDKSSRFAILTKQQYIESGTVHTSKDHKVDWNTIKYLQGQVNSHVWWISQIMGDAIKTDQKRMNSNTQNTNIEVPSMVLLFKDHKLWDENSNKPVPSRPVVSGNCGVNSHLSEILAEIMEPISTNGIGVEISSTEDALCRIDKINKDVVSGMDLTDANVLGEVGAKSVITEVFKPWHEHSTRSLTRSPTFIQDKTVESTNASNSQSMLIGSVNCTRQDYDPRTTADTSETFNDFNFINVSDGDESLVEELMGCINDNEQGTVQAIQQEASRLHGFSAGLSAGNLIGEIGSENLFNPENGRQKRITDFFSGGVIDKNENNLPQLSSNTNFWNNKREKKLRTQCKRRNDKCTLNEKIRDMAEAGSLWTLNENDRIKKCLGGGGLSSETVEVQDFTQTPVMIGGDVVGLYPNMDIISTAELSARAIRETDIVFSGVNYKCLAVYLFLVLGPLTMVNLGLGECIPRRLVKTGAMSLASNGNRNMNNWYLDESVLSENLKKSMLGEMVKVGNLVTMNTTCYSFGGQLYQQSSGAGIGLKSSACLAKLTMGLWDKYWSKIQLTWWLKTIMFIRYVDDIRIYCYPIKQGWYWSDMGWIFKNEENDNRSPLERTEEEICKSLNTVFDFLEFTAETEQHFADQMLPTLDVKLKVLGNGMVTYEHFSKPTNNNLVVQKGTALSSDIIFSSLRQELIRRMTNTCILVDISKRLDVVEAYISLLVNSGHAYSYIKALVTQGLTKYTYLLERADKNVLDRKYLPLHREESFRRNERILLKFIEPMVWFKDLKLKDPYKNAWKSRVTRRPRTVALVQERNGCGSSNPAREITTTMFIPTTPGSLLLKMIREEDEKISKDMDWGIKFMEKSGTPLLNLFMTSFPLEQGCPRNEKCIVCDGDGKKCKTKSVVYIASCTVCSKKLETTRGELQRAFPFSYVGETSRSLRERCLEHKENMLNWKQESFWLQHWMMSHGTENVCPDFSFKTLETLPDPLQRQLAEALHIQERGGLNRRAEYNMNNLCRLEPNFTDWEIEEKGRIMASEKRGFQEKFANFKQVMSESGCTRPYSKSLTNISNPKKICRSLTRKKRAYHDMQHGQDQDQGKEAKKQKSFFFETSTPKAYRVSKEIIDSDQESPIGLMCAERSSDYNSSGGGDGSTGMVVKRTGISQEVDIKCEVQKRSFESKSLEIRRVLTTTMHWERAAIKNGILKKSTSLPGSIDRLEDNYFFGGYQRQRSLSESDIVAMDLDSCSWSIDKEKEQVVAGEEILNVTGVRKENYNPKLEEESNQAAEDVMDEVENHNSKPEEDIDQATEGGPLHRQFSRILLNTPRSVLEQRGADSTMAAPKRLINVSPDERTRHRKISITMDDVGSPTLRKKFNQGVSAGAESDRNQDVQRPRASSSSTSEVVRRKIYKAARRGKSFDTKGKKKRKDNQAESLKDGQQSIRDHFESMKRNLDISNVSGTVPPEANVMDDADGCT